MNLRKVSSHIAVVAVLCGLGQLAQSQGRQPVKGNFEKRIPSSPIGLGMKVEVK